MKVERKQSVILVPYPFQGHVTPMLQLGSILHSQGFSVIVAHTEYNAPNYSNHPEFAFHSMNDGLQGIDISLPSLENMYDMNENCKVPLRNFLVRMMEEEEEEEEDVQGDQLSCIIYDNVMFFVDDVVTQLRIPSIVLRTFSAAYLHSMLTILGQPEKYFPFEDSQLLDPLPELHPLRFKDVPFPAVNNTVPEPVLEFCRAMSDIGSSVATIWNTMQDLENSMLLCLQGHYKVPFFPIGPFHKMAPLASSTSILQEDNSCIEWLDRQAPNSVVYVSLGSLVRIDDKELIETAWGLANSEQPFLWVIRPGSISGFQWAEALPDGFEKMIGERGRIVKWAPQKQVLAHPAVAGFFTHCGWNSTLETICEEVPLICRPLFADQLVNARYLSQIYKVGFELEVIERTVIEKTVRKLMISEEGKDLKKRVVEMKQNIVAGIDMSFPSLVNTYDMNENCKAPLRDYLVRMMEEEEDVRGEQLACIIYDNVMFFVDEVVTQLRLPSIVLRTFSTAYLNSMLTIFQQPEKYFPFEDSQLLDPLPELHPLRFKDLPFPAINNTVPEPVIDFCRAMSDIGSSVATIWNTMQDLEKSLLLRLQEIGPFHKMVPSASSTSIVEEDNSCIE
ncbi:hypothetical protein K7X08_007232 [Anisodus acutangulus]|uniref:UDP-glycosyltransferase n=1 Tax=Anisodus acutangulus TaxID=402998 RepID=A0A9Q1LFF0_9SOLA|nr:hypothetical protein K7X08_007232 [Anisodus acutangulus]